MVVVITNDFTNKIIIVAPALILLAVSLLSLRSVAAEAFNSQLIFCLICLATAWLISRLDYQLYTFSPWPYYFLGLILLSITFFWGDTIRGSTRWLNLFGFSLQTSELIKPLMLLFIATYLPTHYPTNLVNILKYLGLILIPTALVFIQPDLGSAMVILLMCLSGLIAAGVPLRQLAIVSLCFLISLPLIFLMLKPFQRNRLESYFNRSPDVLGSGYNALQAKIAVGSGKFIGRGLGQGTQSHLRYLPERQTDFIFASIVEELGFIGGSLVLSCYALMFVGLAKTAKQAKTETGSIICLIALFVLLIQVFVNIGMNMGLVPITGITLPLISAGGSSLISFAIILGITLSVASNPQTPKNFLEIS